MFRIFNISESKECRLLFKGFSKDWSVILSLEAVILRKVSK
jgi:hypothetical protein